MSGETHAPAGRLRDGTRDFYEAEAPRYDHLRFATAAGRYTDAVQQHIVAGAFEGFAGRAVLEVGCGTGRFTLPLAAAGLQMTGMDLARGPLRVARARLENLDSGARAHLLVGSAYDLPFPDACFDGALSINVFSHLTDPQRALGEIARVLRPGGLVLVNFPNLLSPFLLAGMLVNLRGRSLRRRVYTHWYTWGEIARGCWAAGISITGLRGQWHMPRWLGRWPLSGLARVADRACRDSWARVSSPMVYTIGRKARLVAGVDRRPLSFSATHPPV